MESDDQISIYEDTGKITKFDRELKLKKNTEKYR
jgi:hypothetical protein